MERGLRQTRRACGHLAGRDWVGRREVVAVQRERWFSWRGHFTTETQRGGDFFNRHKKHEDKILFVTHCVFRGDLAAMAKIFWAVSELGGFTLRRDHFLTGGRDGA